VLPLVLTLVGVGGCASNSESRRLTVELNPLIGKADKAYFIDKYGEPDKRTAVDATTDVWEYRFGEVKLNDYASRGNLSTVTLLRATFKNGVLASWQASNALN
jgi:hypothetical protein